MYLLVMLIKNTLRNIQKINMVFSFPLLFFCVAFGLDNKEFDKIVLISEDMYLSGLCFVTFSIIGTDWDDMFM